MGRSSTNHGALTYAAQLLALAMAYIALGRLGLALAPVSRFATLVWPPAGIALAALLLGGYRLWPAITIGAFATNLWIGAPPLVAFFIALGNTAEAVVATFALRRLLPGFNTSLERFRDVVGLVGLAAMASTTISATVGVASLTLSGVLSPDNLRRTWSAWWTGDLLGDLIVAPVLLTWAGARIALPRPPALAMIAALAAFLLAPIALVFMQRPEVVHEQPFFMPYVLFFPLLGAAVRFGVRGATTAMFLVAIAAVWGTYTGHGTFVRADRTESLFALHVFLLATSLTMLLLGSLVSELREKAAVLRGVIDGTPDSVYVKDRLGRYIITNTACARHLGITPAAPPGTADTAVFPAEEVRSMRAEDQEIFRTGQPLVFEQTLTIAGRIRVFCTTKAPYRDRAGDVIGVIGISRDITERKRVEEELRESEARRRVELGTRESEERQRLAVEAANLGVWCWDLERDQLTWTPACRHMHGFGPDDEVSYERFLARLHPEDRQSTEQAIRRSIEAHTEYRIEHRVEWPDGSVRWLAMSGRALCDESDRVYRVVGVTLDITAQKRADQERAELLDRTLVATRAKDEFLAVVSHELRTPLQSMLGWTQILKEPDVDPRLRQKGREAIERNIHAQIRLIEDLLDVSRIVAGKLRLDRTRVELADVVESAIASSKGAVDAKALRVETTIEPLRRQMFGDPFRLQQVVSNLLSNAVKFTPNGGRIGVRLLREGKAAKITIADTGCGIAAEFLPRVFDRFVQADSTRARPYGGLGLGLAIVRQLVDAHGGTVEVASPGRNQGSTFTVTLPLLAAETAAIASTKRKTPAWESTETVTLAGMRVLVVDDEPDACELLEAVLGEQGAEVRAVHSARAVLEVLASFRPEVLMSDLGMPGEDGHALISQVRAREAVEGGHILAVALSAFVSTTDRDQAIALGYEEHLAKPASPEDIVRVVARLVGRAA